MLWGKKYLLKFSGVDVYKGSCLKWIQCLQCDYTILLGGLHYLLIKNDMIPMPSQLIKLVEAKIMNVIKNKGGIW